MNSILKNMEITPETEESKMQNVTNKPVHKHWATWLLTGLVVVLLAALVWQFQTGKDRERQLNQEKRNLQQQVNHLQTERDQEAAAGIQETACTYAPSKTFTDNIKAALDSQNTAAFATYVTDPVKYVIAASEQGGNVSAEEAATSLDYTHSATGPWSFVVTSDYGTGDYADYFGENTIVLKSESGMVAAFEPNCDGSKINQIFVAADEDLL